MSKSTYYSDPDYDSRQRIIRSQGYGIARASRFAPIQRRDGRSTWQTTLTSRNFKEVTHVA